MLPRRAGQPHAVGGLVWRGAIIVALLSALGFCVGQFNPTLMMSGLDAHVFSHCHRGDRDSDCNLVPTVFTVGETRDVVLQQMTAVGYRDWPLTGRDAQWDIDGKSETFTDWFEGPKGGMSFACGYELGILIRFDEAGRLAAAEGDNSPACV